MKIRLSQPQMLSLWRLHRLLEPIRHDAEVTRADGVDLDAILTAEMDQWKIELLLRASQELLVSHDITGEITISSYDDGCAFISLPPEVVRVLSVRLSGWKSSAIPISADTPVAMRQRLPYTRADASSPVAVLSGDGLCLYPASSDSTVTELKCVIYREGEYEFMREALASVSPLDSESFTPLKTVQ